MSLQNNDKLKLKKFKKTIMKFITEPENFKRFSGYDTENFFTFINSKKKYIIMENWDVPIGVC